MLSWSVRCRGPAGRGPSALPSALAVAESGVVNQMNPAGLAFGPVWWSVFLAVVALTVVAVMLLFLRQASKEPVRRTPVADLAPQPELPAVAPPPVELAS
jgi:hypothetical protein